MISRKLIMISNRLDELNIDYPDRVESTLLALVKEVDALTAEELRAEVERVNRTMDPGEKGLESRHFRAAAAFSAAMMRAFTRLADTLDGARQPAPVPNDGPIVWELVIADIREPTAPRLYRDPETRDLLIADMRNRDRLGRERYGVPLQPHNGRDALRDWFEEALDSCAYGKQAMIEEVDGAKINYECSLDLAFDLRRLMARRDAAKEHR